MKYWDSSVLVPLCVEECSTPRMQDVVTWWGSEIECVTALARLEGENALTSDMIAADREPATLEIVSLDNRLAAAAQREGFAVTGL